MQELVSKKLFFSQPEEQDDSSFSGFIGLSIIPIQKNTKQILSNLCLSKISDSSFQKSFTGIDFIDLSSTPDLYIQNKNRFYEVGLNSLGERFKTTHTNSEATAPDADDEDGLIRFTSTVETTENIISDETTYRIVERESGNDVHIPAFLNKNILYKFNTLIQSIETILICDLYLVRKDFLFTLFEEMDTNIKVNNILSSISSLKNKSHTINTTSSKVDYKIEITKDDFTPSVESDSIQYLTTLSTSSISNYNFTIEINNNFDFILLLPSSSKKSFNGSDENFREFKKLVLDTEITDITQTLLDWAQTQINFTEQFEEQRKEFLENFSKKINSDSFKQSYSIIKDVSGIFSCNLLTEILNNE